MVSMGAMKGGSVPMTKRSSLLPVLFVAWFGAAMAAGATGLLTGLRPPMPQLLIIVLTAAVTVAAFAIPAARAWVFGVDVRAMVALHLTRLVGIYFLLLYGRGELPRAFALPAGWGDIAVGVFAGALLAIGPPANPRRRTLYRLWNLLGLIDILLVVGAAARIGLADPASMRRLLELPLSLLPTFIVPLIIASHLLLAERLSPRAAIAPA
jgi:hypothetical protein